MAKESWLPTDEEIIRSASESTKGQMNPNVCDEYRGIRNLTARKIAERLQKIPEDAKGLVDGYWEFGNAVNELLKEIGES